MGSISCLAIFAAFQPYRPVVVVGNSMSPTYRSGELLWTAPVDRPLQRGDVVLIDGPDGPMIKRIALLPGDRRAQWHNACGWLDLTDLEPPARVTSNPHWRTCAVPVGTVYVLGDSLRFSIDSREFGPVSIDRVRRLVVDPRDPSSESAVALQGPRHWIRAAILEGVRRDRQVQIQRRIEAS